MALEALTTAITADGDVTASLTTITKLRSTQEVVQVLYDIDPTLRSTQEIVQVLYTVHVIGPQPLNTDIDVSLLVTADLTIPKLSANIQATGDVQANITGIWQFSTDITAEVNLEADIRPYVKLTAAITATGDVTVNIRENIEYLVAAVAANGDTAADLNVPWHPGNTLELEQTVALDLVISRSLESQLNLQQQLDLVFGQRLFSVEDTLIFIDEATVKRVLPTETASDTLSLTHVAVGLRDAFSYLVLTHSATGTVAFIEGVASNELNLTDLTSPAGTIFTLSAGNQLNLTHLADGDWVGSRSASSNLNLEHNAFAIILANKKYILLQAPFELIQTSVVLPNPLLNDNEGLISNLIIRRSMDNTPRTYVKTSDSRRLRYTFTLNRMKALELEAFFDSYNGANIKMLNWKGELWKIKLITNPIDFVQTRRAEPGGDRTDVNLEFEGTLLNG